MTGGLTGPGGASVRDQPKAHVRKGDGARRTLIVTAAALALVLCAAVVAYATDMFGTPEKDAQPPPVETTSTTSLTDDKAEDKPLYPVDGLYQIRVEHSGMCLGTGPKRGDEQRTVLVQQPCEAAWPDLQLTEIKDGTFTIVLMFDDSGWEKCLGVHEPGTEPGANFSGVDCGESKLLSFKLKALPDGLYQIGIPAGELCMGVEQRSAERGAPFVTTKCDKGQGSQRFEIIPA